MGDLNFYEVDNDYLDFLQSAEREKRGFTRVPNHKYDSNEKFVCGIVLSINSFNYYAPITSYIKQQKDNILIKNDKNETKSSIRFNYMFPVPSFCLSYKDFSKIKDIDYRYLVYVEYGFCLKYQEHIRNKAKRTYEKVIKELSPSLVYNSCDFKLLEQKCLEYQQIIETSREAAKADLTEEQVAPSDENFKNK